MHSANYAVERCPSVYLSVTCRYSVEMAKYIIELISTSARHVILVFPYQTLWQYSDGDPLTGASNAGVCRNRDFRQNLVRSRQ